MSELFPRPAPNFDDPLGMLRACHARMLKFCDVVEYFAAQEADQADHDAARQVHRYFSTAGRHHHDDEEKDIFPILMRQSIKLAEMIQSLKDEHLDMEALWQALEPKLAHPDSIDDRDAFRRLVARFTEAYRRHIKRENEDMLEIAGHIISRQQLKKIGESMAARRGVRSERR